MVAVKLEGRLGNQLFQYAFAYATARRLKTSFYLDKSIDDFLIPQYFEIKEDFMRPLDAHIFSITGYKNIFRSHSKKIFYRFVKTLLLKKKVIVIDNETTTTETLSRLRNNYIYHGFFQSETYFEDFKDEIRALYKIKNKHIGAFELVKKKHAGSKKKVVIHIRRSDYIVLNISLPLTYYKKAIGLITDLDIEYIFISDDPLFVAAEFEYLPNKYISQNNEIIDFQFLVNADVCILSCSSFSWWGAWLNKNSNKKVFAPKFWLGFNEGKEFPLVYPKIWILIG